MSSAKGGEKVVDRRGSESYKVRPSVSPAQGSRQSGADASRNQRGRLRSTSGRATTPRLAACFVVGTPLSSIPRSVSAGVSAGSGRCVADGAGRAGKVGHDEQRLAIAAAVQALLEDGLTANQIRAELGLTKPRYYRALDRLGIPHSPALAGERRSRVELHDLGPDLPYSIQLTAGVPCRFSVHFEGSGFRVSAMPMREDAQEVEL